MSSNDGSSSSHHSSESWGLMPVQMERRLLAYRGGGSVPEGWSIILSNEAENRLVLYNPESRQIVVQSPQNLAGEPLTASGKRCPLCQTELSTDLPSSAHSAADDSGARFSFIDPNYFSLLASAFVAENPRRIEFSSGSASRQQGLSASSLVDGYYARFFQEIRKIGQGFRGQVYHCRHVIEGEVLGEFAVKKIPVGDNHDWFVKMLTEVHMLEKLHHANIVDYKHAWLEHAKLSVNGQGVPCLFILIEYANSGNLAQHLFVSPEQADDGAHADESSAAQKRRNVLKRLAREQSERLAGSQDFTSPDALGKGVLLEEDEIFSMMNDFLQGLHHLHRHGLIHRDLKPQNLLLHRLSPEQRFLTVLVSDFGECEMMQSIGLRRRSGHTGTIEYMAPELLLEDDGEYSKVYDMKSDMWSAGVILWTMMYAGALPWKTSMAKMEDLRSEICAAENLVPPMTCRGKPRSATLRNLLVRLLQREPAARPNAAEALAMLRDVQPETWSEMPLPSRGTASDNPVPLSSTRFMQSQALVALQALPAPQPWPATPAKTPVSRGSPAPGSRDHEVHRVATAPRQYVGLVLVLLKVVSLRMACSPLAPSELVLYAITSLSLVDVVLLAERPRNGSALLYCSSAVQAALMVQAGIPLIAAALVTLLAPILASVWPWSL